MDDLFYEYTFSFAKVSSTSNSPSTPDSSSQMLPVLPIATSVPSPSLPSSSITHVPYSVTENTIDIVTSSLVPDHFSCTKSGSISCSKDQNQESLSASSNANPIQRWCF